MLLEIKKISLNQLTIFIDKIFLPLLKTIKFRKTLIWPQWLERERLYQIHYLFFKLREKIFYGVYQRPTHTGLACIRFLNETGGQFSLKCDELVEEDIL
jgi:hypothetical protein